MGNGRIYRCSDGRYFGEADLWDRFEAGVWQPCCWDTDSGDEWVETRDGRFLSLHPIPPSDVPEWADVERDADGIRVTGQRTVAAD